MNKVAAIKRLNDKELELGTAGTPASWHQKYFQCDAIYVGGLPDSFAEHDLVAVLEQYGTVLHVNLVRDSNTNSSRGFAFVKYADPRSCILAIDNLNGFEVSGRALRLDHADEYRDKDGLGLNTSPPGFRMHLENASTATEEQEQTPAAAVEMGAEKRRQNAVLNRLEQLRKRRRINGTNEPNTDATSEHSSPSRARDSFNEQKPSVEKDADKSDKKERRIEKEKRRREKERRKEERARIRRERAERRAARQSGP